MSKIPPNHQPHLALTNGFELVYDGEAVCLYNGDLIMQEPIENRSALVSGVVLFTGMTEAEIAQAVAQVCDAGVAVTARLAEPEAEGAPPPASNPADVWKHRETLKDFMANIIEIPEGLAKDFVFPGGVTTIAAPSSSGKSVVIYALANALAQGGVFRYQRLQPARVLLVDFDNPRSIVQKRLQGICDNYDIDLQIIGRDHAPQLLDDAAWAAMPAGDHDVIIIDSFGSATIGVSEKEGAKLQRALETLNKIADRGPAVIVLDNTEKSASSYRGRGEKTERVDVFFEVRDITDWTPPQGEQWWRHIPSAGDAEWQERAARKSGQTSLRVAFVCRKFRWDEEPMPFALELDFATTPWTLSDVTEEVETAGHEASQEQERERKHKQLTAANALVGELARLGVDSGPMGLADAVEFLRAECGLSRNVSRNLLDAFNAEIFPDEGLWKLSPITGSHGSKTGVFPLMPKTGGRKTEDGKPNKINGDFAQSFSHPHDMPVGERLTSTDIDNEGLTESHLSPTHFSHSRGEKFCPHENPYERGDDLVCRDCGQVVM